MNLQAELITVGNELLSGWTLNTHGKDLGKALAAIGLQLIRDTTIPDEQETIGTALREALARTELVFISGGLGPTVDDITRDALAKALDQKIVLDHPTVKTITERYTARGRSMTPAAERQALVLEQATVLPNSVGAAPGQKLNLPCGRSLYVLPGPPNEFNAILNEEILPELKHRFTHVRPKKVRVIRTKGIGESDIVTRLEQEQFKTPAEVDIGFYPGQGKVQIRLTAAETDDPASAGAEQVLKNLLADYLEPPTETTAENEVQ